MSDYEALFAALTGSPAAPWVDTLFGQLEHALDPGRHGELHKWQELVSSLPAVKPSVIDLTADRLQIGMSDDVDEATRERIESALRQLHPWRKGPFELFGITIDTEWRSDWKWRRVVPHLAPLAGRRVLDIGCGNGYYGWRMAGSGAALVAGVDPTLRYVMQFETMKRFIGPTANWVLPLTGEQVPAIGAFDTVLSMGVLYHRRDPLAHLRMLREHLRPGGEAVVESLVVAGGAGAVLHPEGRYAKMKNVWAIPSPETLVVWMTEAGFHNARCVDITPTTVGEQRRTDWMTFESLADFLDPQDPARTVEGHPAPVRAVVIAER